MHVAATLNDNNNNNIPLLLRQLAHDMTPPQMTLTISSKGLFIHLFLTRGYGRSVGGVTDQTDFANVL